jgi:hypothetical protein
MLCYQTRSVPFYRTIYQQVEALPTGREGRVFLRAPVLLDCSVLALKYLNLIVRQVDVKVLQTSHDTHIVECL